MTLVCRGPGSNPWPPVPRSGHSTNWAIGAGREICVKDFSGITALRILKFGTNVGYVLLHCARENQPPDAYCFLYLSIFLSLQSNCLLWISRLLWEPVFKFYTPWEWPSILWDRKPSQWDLFLPFSSHFSISHSNVVHREICVKDFSGTTAPRILKFGTNVG